MEKIFKNNEQKQYSKKRLFVVASKSDFKSIKKLNKIVVNYFKRSMLNLFLGSSVGRAVDC